MALLAEKMGSSSINNLCFSWRGRKGRMAWHDAVRGAAGAGWRGPATVAALSQGTWLLLRSQDTAGREGGRVLRGHPAEMPRLALPKNTSGQTEHLGEPSGGLESPVWGRGSANLATKAGGHPCRTRSISRLKSHLQPNHRERSQSKAKAVTLWFLHLT